MTMIYEPTGKAREYSPLAANYYSGCTHGCKYCYAPRILRRTEQDFHENVGVKKDALKRLAKDAEKLRGDDREILLSFTTDPYQPVDQEWALTREAMEILIRNGLSFTVLTKGGGRAARDFDLLEKYEKCRFGTTLVFTDQGDADVWEPGAASVADRFRTVVEAHRRGIPTWVSLEPVIDPVQALELVEWLAPFVDEWKVGKINYHPAIERNVDWSAFCADIASTMEAYGADYHFKESMRPYRRP